MIYLYTIINRFDMSNTPPHSFTDIYSQLIGTNTPEKKSDYIMLRDKIAFIIECLLDATQPIEVIVRQTALEIA